MYSLAQQASFPFHFDHLATERHGNTLCVQDGAGSIRAASESEIVNAALAITARNCAHGVALTHPKATQNYLQLQLASMPYEIFGLIHLDNRHRVLSVEVLFRGTIDGANVHPREVVRSVIEKNAAAVIAFHNHPSGIAEPSRADELITCRLKEALNLVDVRVLDHIVVGAEGCQSFAERGLL